MHKHKERTRASFKYCEVLMTKAVGGVDIDIRLLMNLEKFIKDHCIVGLCPLRGALGGGN